MPSKETHRKSSKSASQKDSKRRISTAAYTSTRKKTNGTSRRSSKTRIDSTLASTNSFPVVGVGASAGGLEAFTKLLNHLPADTGMGFVLVQHLDPVHKSALTSLLSKATAMPVREVVNNAQVEANHVYVIPPNTSLTIARGVLKLLPRKKTQSPHRPIDYFYQSLAEDQRERAITVILSGTASDGTLGCEAIKAEGGITFAQDESAKYDSMPRHAIAAGCIDFVLSPEEIAKELTRIARHPYIRSDLSEEANSLKSAREIARSGRKLAGAKEDPYQKILTLLGNRTGVDFSLYKSNTIKRRIGRRTVLSKLKTPDDYLHHLKSDAKEVDALYQDMLIGVTGFFRNPEAFEVLKKSVFPKLLKDRSPNDVIRIWVLGCSTGQEAYSIAMAFLEFVSRENSNVPLQVFATDLNDTQLERARAGLYTKALVSDVSPERLNRFFVEEDGGYRISKSIREMCVFARQNILSDPPFSRMDLIACRNLLIYLEPKSHKKILPTFHYALKPNGFLFLGVSETVGANTDLFSPVDKKHRIYIKKPAAAHVLGLPLPAAYSVRQRVDSPRAPINAREGSELEAQREADRVTLSKYGPPGVLVNADLDILQFRGVTSRYLTPAAGRASLNLLKMAREGLLLPLRAAINTARKANQRVRKERVRIDQNGHTFVANIEVVPLKNIKERCYLVLFEAADQRARGGSREAVKDKSPAKPGKKAAHTAADTAQEILDLRRELAEMRNYAQSILEEHEAANEELQASNEEVQSANEELQSINEELETSKEELESTNEELITVNEEMQKRNQELNRLNDDMKNLHSSAHMPIVVLGRDLTIRRFTAAAEKELNLLATDIGQSISRIKTNLDFPGLEEMITEVIRTAAVSEKEVEGKDGRCYSLRVRPFLTIDNKVDGAVMVLVDITKVKQTEQRVREERNYAQAIVRTVPNPLIVLNKELRVETASQSFYRDFEVTPSETGGRLIYELGNRQWDIPALRKLLEDILPKKTFFIDYEVTHEFETIGPRTMLLSASRLESTGEVPELILLNIEDITQRKRSEAALRQSEAELRQLMARESAARADAESANRFKDEFLAIVSHELRTPLNAIVGWTHMLKRGSLSVEDSERAIQSIDRNTTSQATIIHELLDVSSIISGKLQLDKKPVDVAAAINAALDNVRPLAESKGVEIVTAYEGNSGAVAGDFVRLQQVFSNLLDNAVKFTPRNGTVQVRLEHIDSQVGITISDTGEGIPTDFLPHIFERFKQADTSTKRTHGGLGLGLSIVHNLITMHGGQIQATSEGLNQGSTFKIRLPLIPAVFSTELVSEPPIEGAKETPNAEEGETTGILRGVRILVVDDQKDTRELLKFALMGYGAEINLARSATEALKAVREWRPDVIISDIGMPREDGYEMMKKIRALNPEGGGQVPAVALTGYASGEDESRALSAGYQTHLAKPVNLRKLAHTVDRLVQQTKKINGALT